MEPSQPISKMLLAGEPHLCSKLAQLLRSKYSKGQCVNNDKLLTIKNKYFTSEIQIDTESLICTPDIETNYVRLNENGEESSCTFALKSSKSESCDNKDGVNAEDEKQKKRLSQYDCVIALYAPGNSESEQFDRVCKFIKTLNDTEFEVKILFLDAESSFIEKFNTEELFEKTESFIEVIGENLSKVTKSNGDKEEDEQMNSHGEWGEKEGFARVGEALENCMWRHKTMNSQLTETKQQVKKEPTNFKKKKKPQSNNEGNIFALMGQSLNSKASTKAKKDSAKKDVKTKKNEKAEKPKEQIKKIEPKKETEKKVNELLKENPPSFEEVDNFSKMFSKINNFKLNRDSMTHEQRKEGATKIMLELMKGLGEDPDVDELNSLQNM